MRGLARFHRRDPGVHSLFQHGKRERPGGQNRIVEAAPGELIADFFLSVEQEVLDEHRARKRRKNFAR